MKLHATCILLLPLIAVAAGCRRDPQLAVYLDAVNAEKRMLEDRLYELQHKYDAAQEELERLKRSENGGGERSRRPARSDRPRAIDELPPPKIEMPSQPGDAEELDLRPPTIEPGQPAKPDQSSSDRRPVGQTVSARSATTRQHRTASEVTQVVIDPDHTAGVDRDGRTGDDGLRLTLQPRDRTGRFLPRAAPVTVELYDRRDPAEPLAVWEFTRDETELSLHRADVGRGIRLQMKLPPDPRTHSDYRVRVVYAPDSRRPLVAEQNIVLTPHAQTSSRWTPRSPD